MLLILLAFMQTVTSQQAKDAAAIQWGTILVDSTQRSYAFYVPEGIKPSPKLIFVLHGSTMTTKQMIMVTGNQFNTLADNGKDVIIVYPQGYKKHWNDCRESGAYEANLLDLGEGRFFGQIIHELERQYNIEKQNIFVTGYSNGGHLGFKLAREQPDMFKGFAIIGANLPVTSNNDCKAGNVPVSIMIANGTEDPINPYQGGRVASGSEHNYGDVMSTEATVQYWTDLMKCNELIETNTDFPNRTAIDSSNVLRKDYFCRENKKMVSHIQIINGGHTIPNPTFTSWPKYLGNTNKDINLPEIIFNYFYSLE